jgi:hypothetical protein
MFEYDGDDPYVALANPMGGKRVWRIKWKILFLVLVFVFVYWDYLFYLIILTTTLMANTY